MEREISLAVMPEADRSTSHELAAPAVTQENPAVLPLSGEGEEPRPGRRPTLIWTSWKRPVAATPGPSTRSLKKYTPKLYGLVYHMTSNREDTNDILQDVFAKAYRALKRFRGKSSFYTWITRSRRT